MKQFLILCLISYPFLGLFSTQSAAEDSETPKYTDEQLQKLRAAEEKYKDNPGIMNMINKLKENSGITDAVVPEKDPEPAPVMAHGKVITHGSYQDADAALRNNDMETTIANYRIMAAEGDTEVSVKLGYIYETEGDIEAAYAAYKQAADSEDNNEAKKMALERIKWLDKNVMNDEETEQSNQIQYRAVTPPSAPETSSAPEASPAAKSTYNIQSSKPRAVKVTLEKINDFQHFKPEKYTRTPKS